LKAGGAIGVSPARVAVESWRLRGKHERSDGRIFEPGGTKGAFIELKAKFAELFPGRMRVVVSVFWI
jgi:hypothetical protein